MPYATRSWLIGVLNTLIAVNRLHLQFFLNTTNKIAKHSIVSNNSS
jgi:hypothetical protein